MIYITLDGQCRLVQEFHLPTLNLRFLDQAFPYTRGNRLLLNVTVSKALPTQILQQNYLITSEPQIDQARYVKGPLGWAALIVDT